MPLKVIQSNPPSKADIYIFPIEVSYISVCVLVTATEQKATDWITRKDFAGPGGSTRLTEQHAEKLAQ